MKSGQLAARMGPWPVAVALIGVLVLSATPPRAFADSGSVAYTFGSALSQNQSNYTLFYSIPPVIHVGEKTNMTFYVYLTELSGWKVQSQRQVLRVIVNTASQSVVAQEAQNNLILYQGGRWGPFNVTLDLTESELGLSPGQLTNATVFANLVVYEQYDNPAAPFLLDDGATIKLMGVEVAAPTGNSGPVSDRSIISIGVGTAVVLALAGFAVVLGRRGRP